MAIAEESKTLRDFLEGSEGFGEEIFQSTEPIKRGGIKKYRFLEEVSGLIKIKPYDGKEDYSPVQVTLRKHLEDPVVS